MVSEPFSRVWMIYPHLDGSLPLIVVALSCQFWREKRAAITTSVPNGTIGVKIACKRRRCLANVRARCRNETAMVYFCPTTSPRHCSGVASGNSLETRRAAWHRPGQRRVSWRGEGGRSWRIVPGHSSFAFLRNGILQDIIICISSCTIQLTALTSLARLRPTSHLPCPPIQPLGKPGAQQRS
jgi:hypothetical protein